MDKSNVTKLHLKDKEKRSETSIGSSFRQEK